MVTGTYTITAQSVGDNHDLHDKLDIVIIAPIPELNVSEVKATKEDGTNVSKYDAGDLAYFSTNLTSESDTPVLVTVNVFDAKGNTLGVGFFKSTIGAGDSEIVLGFELPNDVVSGVAEVYTNVFSYGTDKGVFRVSVEKIASVELI